MAPALPLTLTPQRQIDNDPVNPCVKRTLAMELVEFLRTRRQSRLEKCPGRLPAGPRVVSEAGRDGPDSGAPEGRMPPSGSLGMLARGCGRLDARSSRSETPPPGLKFPQGTTFTEHENAAAFRSAHCAHKSVRQEPFGDRGKGEHKRTRERSDRLLAISSPRMGNLSPSVSRIEFGQCKGRRTLWRRDRQIDR